MNRSTYSWGETRGASGSFSATSIPEKDRTVTPIVRRQIETTEKTIKIRFFDSSSRRLAIWKFEFVIQNGGGGLSQDDSWFINLLFFDAHTPLICALRKGECFCVTSSLCDLWNVSVSTIQ